MCFALGLAAQGEPDVIKGPFSDSTHVLDLLSGLLGNVTDGLYCPNGVTFDNTALSQPRLRQLEDVWNVLELFR
jgi:hypothetical protein